MLCQHVVVLGFKFQVQIVRQFNKQMYKSRSCNCGSERARKDFETFKRCLSLTRKWNEFEAISKICLFLKSCISKANYCKAFDSLEIYKTFKIS